MLAFGVLWLLFIYFIVHTHDVIRKDPSETRTKMQKIKEKNSKGKSRKNEKESEREREEEEPHQYDIFGAIIYP